MIKNSNSTNSIRIKLQFRFNKTQLKNDLQVPFIEKTNRGHN